MVNSVSGFPVSFPYTLILERDTANEEVVDVTAAAGTTLTVVRGRAGTTGVAHSTGASVVHGVSHRDFDEPQAHIAASSGVHGIAGALVGTSDIQALSNKTLASPVFTGTASFADASASGSVRADAAQLGGVAPTRYGTALLSVGTVSATNPGIVVRGVAGQTANLITVQNSAGTDLGSLDASGNIAAANLTTAWASTTVSLSNTTGATVTFRYRQVGKTVFYSLLLSGGATVTNGAVDCHFTLPFSWSAVSTQASIAAMGTGASPWVYPGQISGTTFRLLAAGSIGSGVSIASLASTGVMEIA